MIREASTRAKLVPLVFEQERVRIEIMRAERVLERGKKRVELFARQRDALLSEATRLVDASNSLDMSSGKDPKKLVKDLLGTTAAKGPRFTLCSSSPSPSPSTSYGKKRSRWRSSRSTTSRPSTRRSSRSPSGST
jgi:hypothetical protein